MGGVACAPDFQSVHIVSSLLGLHLGEPSVRDCHTEVTGRDARSAWPYILVNAYTRTSKSGAQTSSCYYLPYLPHEQGPSFQDYLSLHCVKGRRIYTTCSSSLLIIVDTVLRPFLHECSRCMIVSMLYSRDDILGSAAPPPGVTPNFIDPPNNGHVVIIVNTVFATISLLFVGLRGYTAICITRRVRTDDCKPLHCSCGENLLISIDLLFVSWVRSLSDYSSGKSLIYHHGLSSSLYYSPSLTTSVGGSYFRSR